MANVIVDIVDPFDPRTETLRSFIDRYEKTGQDQGRFKARIDRKTNKPKSGTGIWPARTLLENAPGIKEFLDKPLIELLSSETRSNPEVGYNKAIVTPAARQKTVGAGRIEDIKGAMQAIYSNSARQFLRLNIPPETVIVNPADTIVVPRGSGGQRGSSVKKQAQRINPFKVGELQLKLEDYVNKNPADAPIARAILFGLNQGYRVDEFLGITSDNIIDPPVETGRTEPTFANIVPKTSTEINGPLTSQSLALLEDQGLFLTDAEFNEGNKVVEGKGLSNLADVDTPYIWTYRTVDKNGNIKAVPIDETDVNRVLKEVPVEGLFEEEIAGKPGVFSPVTKPAKSKDLRRINATIYEAIGEQKAPVALAALMKGRDIKKGGALETRYQAGSQGIFDSSLDTVRGHFDNFMTGQYQRALIQAGRIEEGTTISPYATFSNKLINKKYLLAAERAGVAINLPAPPRSTQGVSSLSKEAGSTTPQGIIDVGTEKPEISEESKSKFKAFAKNGMKVLGGLGLYGAFEAGRLAYDKARGEGASQAMAGVAGVGTGLYEIAEPLPLTFIRPQPVGEGSEIIPDYESRVEEQMSRIRQYDEREREKEPGVNVELFTRDDPQFLTGE